MTRVNGEIKKNINIFSAEKCALSKVKRELDQVHVGFQFRGHFLLFLNHSMSYGYALELPQQGDSNAYPDGTF